MFSSQRQTGERKNLGTTINMGMYEQSWPVPSAEPGQQQHEDDEPSQLCGKKRKQASLSPASSFIFRDKNTSSVSGDKHPLQQPRTPSQDDVRHGAAAEPTTSAALGPHPPSSSTAPAAPVPTGPPGSPIKRPCYWGSWRERRREQTEEADQHYEQEQGQTPGPSQGDAQDQDHDSISQVGALVEHLQQLQHQSSFSGAQSRSLSHPERRPSLSATSVYRPFSPSNISEEGESVRSSNMGHSDGDSITSRNSTVTTAVNSAAPSISQHSLNASAASKPIVSATHQGYAQHRGTLQSRDVVRAIKSVPFRCADDTRSVSSDVDGKQSSAAQPRPNFGGSKGVCLRTTLDAKAELAQAKSTADELDQTLPNSPFLRIEHFMVPNPSLAKPSAEATAQESEPEAPGFRPTPARGFMMLVYLLSGGLQCQDSRPEKVQQPPSQSSAATGSKAPATTTTTSLRRGDAMCLSMGRGLIYSLRAHFTPPSTAVAAADSNRCSNLLSRAFSRITSLPTPCAAIGVAKCPITAIGGRLGLSPGGAAGTSASPAANRVLPAPSTSTFKPSHSSPAPFSNIGSSGFAAPSAPQQHQQQQQLAALTPAALEDLQHTSGLRIWLDIPRYAKLSEPCSLVVRGGAQPKLPASAAGRSDFQCPEAGRCNLTVEVLKPVPGVSEELQGSGWCCKRVLDVGCRKMGANPPESIAAICKDADAAAQQPPSFALFDISLAPGARVFQPIALDHAATVYNLGPSCISIGDRRQACQQGRSLVEHDKFSLLVLSPAAQYSARQTPDAVSHGVWINNTSQSKPTRVCVISARPTPPAQTICWPASQNKEEDQFVVTNACEHRMTQCDWRVARNGFEAKPTFS